MKRNLLLQYYLPVFFTVFILSSCREPCDKGYEGKRCDVPVRDKFKGTWSATDNPGALTYLDTITDGSDILDVYVSRSFSNSRYYRSVKATVDGNTITIANQKPDTSKIYVEGTGIVTDDHKTINWNYNLINKYDTPFITTSYTGVWTKQ